MAIENFERACANHYAPSCFNAAVMYRSGMGIRQDRQLAAERLRQAYSALYEFVAILNSWMESTEG